MVEFSTVIELNKSAGFCVPRTLLSNLWSVQSDSAEVIQRCKNVFVFKCKGVPCQQSQRVWHHLSIKHAMRINLRVQWLKEQTEYEFTNQDNKQPKGKLRGNPDIERKRSIKPEADRKRKEMFFINEAEESRYYSDVLRLQQRQWVNHPMGEGQIIQEVIIYQSREGFLVGRGTSIKK